MDDRSRLIAWRHEMTSVHQRLRDAIAVVREAVDDAGPDLRTVVSGDLLVYCRAFCTALDGHHRGEATALFPRLQHVHPELAEAVGKLLQDHSMIDHLLAGLQSVLDRQDAAPQQIIRHLDGIEAVMETHFRFEEKVLAQALDELTDHTLDVRSAFGPLA
ncbi:MAG: hemerythrin domain-containing protein [Thermocrispum sp.]